MPDHLAAVFGFGAIFLIVGAFGGDELSPLALAIFLTGSGLLIAYGAAALGITALRRRAAARPVAVQPHLVRRPAPRAAGATIVRH